MAIYSYSILLISTLEFAGFLLLSSCGICRGITRCRARISAYSRLPVLGGADLCVAGHDRDPSHWPLADRALFRSSSRSAKRIFAFPSRACANTASRSPCSGGESPRSSGSLLQRFRRDCVSTIWPSCSKRKELMAFTARRYGQLSPIIPYVITAPFYFAGTHPARRHDADRERLRARRGRADLLHQLIMRRSPTSSRCSTA